MRYTIGGAIALEHYSVPSLRDCYRGMRDSIDDVIGRVRDSYSSTRQKVRDGYDFAKSCVYNMAATNEEGHVLAVAETEEKAQHDMVKVREVKKTYKNFANSRLGRELHDYASSLPGHQQKKVVQYKYGDLGEAYAAVVQDGKIAGLMIDEKTWDRFSGTLAQLYSLAHEMWHTYQKPLTHESQRVPMEQSDDYNLHLFFSKKAANAKTDKAKKAYEALAEAGYKRATTGQVNMEKLRKIPLKDLENDDYYHKCIDDAVEEAEEEAEEKAA